MRKYEIMFIIRPNLDDESRKQVIENFTNILTERKAEIVKVDNWGLKTLAYEINDLRKGHYVVMQVNAPLEAVNEFERLARISEDIIRYIIIKDEE
ncbi:30S ribosomal protein S6 [Mycoplasmatota bacterium]|nr:30S ribosomal protein S6 [Mycoplasmatota bacterium]